MATLTLLDVMRQRTDPFEKGVISTLIVECDIMKKLPWVTIGTTEVGHRRTNSVPSVGFRKRGQGFGPVKGGAYDEVVDAIYPLGATITIDKIDYEDKRNAENPLVLRTKEAMEGVAATFNHYFVNGDKAVDEDGFEGIKVRMATAPTSQTVYANTASAALDLTPAANSGAGPTTSEMYQWLERIEEAKYALDGHSGDVALTTAAVLRRLKGILRRLSLYKDTPADEPHMELDNQRRTSAEKPNRPHLRWLGLDWYDVGPKGFDQSSEIIGNETIGGQSTTPIYLLKLGKPYLYGIQQYPIQISPTELLPDRVTYQTVIDWPVGLHHVHPRWGAVVRGQKVV